MIRTYTQCLRIATHLSAVMMVVMTSVLTSHAQPLLNAADSAASARRLVRDGITAFRAGDSVAGHKKLVSATEVWPTQSEYFWTRAQLAAAAHDTADVIASLSAFAAFGTSRSLATDRFLSTLATHPRLSAVSAQLRTNAAPLIRSTVRATLPDSTIWPEGVAYDARAHRFFVGSVRHRTVYVHDARGTRALWTDARANVGAILGVAVDPDGAHVWATTAGIPQMQGYAPPDSGIAALLKVRIADGTIVTRFDLPPTALGHTLGDVVVSATGDVFTSDSRDPVLYRLRRGTTVLESYRDPLFRSLQGVAPAPGAAHVYVADYSHGLLRLNLATGAVTRLTDAPHTTSLGVDGLVFYRQSLIGVQNGVAPARIARFHLDAAGTRIVRVDIIDRNTAVADEPTIGVIVGRSYVYVANSQWEKYDDAGKRVPGSVLAPAVLLTVPLLR